MTALVDQVIERLRAAGVVLEPGLSVEELARVEKDFELDFSVVHREFIMRVLPVGGGWWDWRHDDPDMTRQYLKRPLEGVLFDVENNSFWPRSWGTKPPELETRLKVAEARMAAVPKLVPVYGHRYMIAGLGPGVSPVFSVYQTDVVYYGYNLLDYVAQQFHVGPRNISEPPHIPFWSDLAIGLESDEM